LISSRSFSRRCLKRIGLLSFIDDPQAEMERIRKEQEGSIDLEALLGAMEEDDAG
jgi:hypothetical protein